MARSSGSNEKTWVAILKLIAALVLSLLGKKAAKSTPAKRSSSSPVEADGTIAELFRAKQSDQIVTSEGQVVKVLKDDLDDTDGSGMHQQFLVDVAGGVTIKIAHNLKFGRVPVREGDNIRFKGEYEWNERGGCIHWTHHDPKKWHEDGWIEHRGKRFE